MDSQALENKKNRIKANNTINVLHPYRTEQGAWAYDDKDLGVYNEHFVLGSSEAIDQIILKTYGKRVDNFRMLISKNPIPQYSAKIIRREDLEKQLGGMEGWYQLDGTEHVLWLCDCFNDYLPGYVPEVYVKFEMI